MRKTLITSLVACGLWAPHITHAETPEEFYRGKQVTVKVGFPPGSGYDLAGRLVARHIGAHIAGNPTIIVQNVVGAGSLTLANQMYRTAPRDGTALALVSNAVAATPLLSPSTAQFDPRQFNWIGSNAPEIDVVVSSNQAPHQTIHDLQSQTLIVGASGLGGAIFDLPQMSNALLGTKFQIIAGYDGAAKIFLAIQRGELQGLSGIGWSSVKASQLNEIKSGRLRVLAQFGWKKHAELPDVPLFDKPKNETDYQAVKFMYARMQYGRPFLMPPETPQDRVQAMREAFKATMKDKDLLAQAERFEFEIDPISGEDLDGLTKEIMATPPAAVALLREILDLTKEK